MKKAYIIALLPLILLLASCNAGQSKGDRSVPPYTAVESRFDSSIQAAYRSLIIEHCQTEQEASPGYALTDFNQDGIPELCIRSSSDYSVHTYLRGKVTEFNFPDHIPRSDMNPFFPVAYRNVRTNKLHWFYHIGESDFGSNETGIAEIVFDPDMLRPTLHEKHRCDWDDVWLDKDRVLVYVDLNFFVNGLPASEDEYEKVRLEWEETYRMVGNSMGYDWYDIGTREEVSMVLAAWKPVEFPALEERPSGSGVTQIYRTATRPQLETTARPID